MRDVKSGGDGEYPHLVTIDPQHAGINTAISEGFSSVERRASSRQEAHETVIKENNYNLYLAHVSSLVRRPVSTHGALGLTPETQGT